MEEDKYIDYEYYAYQEEQDPIKIESIDNELSFDLSKVNDTPKTTKSQSISIELEAEQGELTEDERFNALLFYLGKTSFKPVIKQGYTVEDAVVGLRNAGKGLERIAHLRLELSNNQYIFIKREDVKLVVEDDVKMTFYIKNDYVLYIFKENIIYSKTFNLYKWE